eukprot:15191341-Alexandrium_andersonii.AAC.1
MVAKGYNEGFDSPFFPLNSPPLEQLNNCARPLATCGASRKMRRHMCHGGTWGVTISTRPYRVCNPSIN